MIASCICKDIDRIIKSNKNEGEIHSIFDNSFNVITCDNSIVTILRPDKSMSPNSIKVIDNISFLSLGMKRGEKVEFNKDYMSLINKEIKIYYDKSIRWNSEPNLVFVREKKKTLEEKLNLVGLFLQKSGNRDGILPLLNTLDVVIEDIQVVLDKDYRLNKSEEFIYKRFIDFIKAFKNNKLDEISGLTKKIIGFGSGLTPSMDDFICGLMVANIYLTYFLDLDMDLAYKINYEIVKDIDNKTTKISEEMLKLSSQGKVSEDIRDLLLSMLSCQDIKDTKVKIAKVADFGHSSGTDILSGIYIGSKILLNNS